MFNNFFYFISIKRNQERKKTQELFKKIKNNNYVLFWVCLLFANDSQNSTAFSNFVPDNERLFGYRENQQVSQNIKRIISVSPFFKYSSLRADDFWDSHFLQFTLWMLVCKAPWSPQLPMVSVSWWPWSSNLEFDLSKTYTNHTYHPLTVGKRFQVWVFDWIVT